MNHTKEQYDAISIHNRNLVVTAGAGSGKTRVLVERYLALLVAHEDWDLNALVAITFTSKAAQEMRDRVRLELEKRLREAITADAAQRWSNLLAQMESARIDTIHALCASILRANAAEAGIDPAFRVLDDVAANILLEDAVDTTFQQLMDEGHPAAALFSIYDDRMIRDALTPDLVGANLPELPSDLFDEWQRQWEVHAQDTLTNLLHGGIFERFRQWQPPHSAREDRLYLVWESCCLELETLHQSESLPARLGALKALIQAVNLKVGSKGAWGGDENLKQAKDFLRSLRETGAEAVAAIGEPLGDLEREAARLLPFWLELLRRVQNLFREAKARDGLLDFNDLESRARDLLVGNVHVRERYRGREFKHVLVDEFQDTNEAQWDIVRALADPMQPGSLFIVGDEKQSIYAFRGADVRVFGAARETIVNAGGMRIPLAQSFRTHKPLVDSFNSLFEHLLTQSAPHRHYEVKFDQGMTAARATPPHDAPAMELILIDKSLLQVENDKAAAARREAYEIAQRLQLLVNAETPIYDKERHHSSGGIQRHGTAVSVDGACDGLRRSV
ncbi:MAG: UvrD-helicase domain-containing protein [Anaerolineae bacterium]